MSKKVLVITTMAGADDCVRSLAEKLRIEVELATSRKAALAGLRREEFGVVVLEESLAESDPEWAEEIRMAAGRAIPVQANFAISGCARLGREVQAALLRRDREQALARREATAELESELKSSLTGLLLESELALEEMSAPASLEPKLRHLVELAGAMRDRLGIRAEGAAGIPPRHVSR